MSNFLINYCSVHFFIFSAAPLKPNATYKFNHFTIGYILTIIWIFITLSLSIHAFIDIFGMDNMYVNKISQVLFICHNVIDSVCRVILLMKHFTCTKYILKLLNELHLMHYQIAKHKVINYTKPIWRIFVKVFFDEIYFVYLFLTTLGMSLSDHGVVVNLIFIFSYQSVTYGIVSTSTIFYAGITFMNFYHEELNDLIKCKVAQYNRRRAGLLRDMELSDFIDEITAIHERLIYITGAWNKLFSIAISIYLVDNFFETVAFVSICLIK